MSLLGLFNIGRSALLASQTALSTTNNNIANVNTPGYSRQNTVLTISSPIVRVTGGYVGIGVTVGSIRRSYDGFIQSQLFGQQSQSGSTSAMEETYAGVESLFNESSGTGLSDSLKGFINAWSGVAADPGDIAERTSLLHYASDLVSVAQRTERELTGILGRIDAEMADTVKQVNAKAVEIARLNGKITEIEVGNTSAAANDYRDARDALLSEITSLVNASYYENQDGSITVMVGMRNLVSGNTASPITLSKDAFGDIGFVLDGIDITGRISGGRIGGLLTAKGEIEGNVLAGLRRLMASVAREVNAIHAGGTGLDASTGLNFFTPLSVSIRDYSDAADVTAASVTDQSLLTLDEYEISFDGTGNYSVTNFSTGSVVTSGAYSSGSPIGFDGMEVTITGAPGEADRFLVSPLGGAIRDLRVLITNPRAVAAASGSSGLPGDNTNALLLAGLSDTALSALGGETFQAYYSGIVTRAGTKAREASDMHRFNENILGELERRRESVSGVSLDEEAANLIRFQRAFEAGARMIKVTDELLQTVIDL